MKFGIYRLHEPLEENDLARIEDTYGTAIDIVSVYRAWNLCSIEDDLSWLDRLKSSTRDVLLTWEPWILPMDAERPYDQPDFALKNIIAGRYDDYVRSFARELSSFPRTIFLRVMHEMNGNWYPWCGTVNGNSQGDFIAAWNHIRDLVNGEAPIRIQWVWSPYARSYPLAPQNRMECYFPGDELIDWVAIDGYNWGHDREWASWQSFEEIFSDAYNTLIALSRCPIMIGEIASTGTGGNKALWITDALRGIHTKFPRIQALIWFDVRKECDWRITSSLESLEAFRSGIKLFNRPA